MFHVPMVPDWVATKDRSGCTCKITQRDPISHTLYSEKPMQRSSTPRCFFSRRFFCISATRTEHLSSSLGSSGSSGSSTSKKNCGLSQNESLFLQPPHDFPFHAPLAADSRYDSSERRTQQATTHGDITFPWITSRSNCMIKRSQPTTQSVY